MAKMFGGRPCSGIVLLQEEFEDLVSEAIGNLPKALLGRLNNVSVVVEQWPSKEQVEETQLDNERQLLGLYQGIPLTDRESYNLVLPDKITIFQGPLQAMCHSREELAQEIKLTLTHEIAHHFGINDEWLENMGLG